ncbi:hypothetical protein OIO90_002436 [Microbotryomycetes sp. JL221]|nr:hypothetical protein OIO90_002436 [Microbotryomycetes sp. JL221]
MVLAPPRADRCCWATLLTKASYLQGCLVLHASLVTKHKSTYPLVVFATPELDKQSRAILEQRDIIVRDIDYLEPVKELKTTLDGHDHRFADTWTKLRVFELVEYDRVILLDSDMLVLDNMDELMTMPLEPGWIAAAHACTCNPRKLAHYPKDWVPENCGHRLSRGIVPGQPEDFSKPTHHLLNSGLVVLTPSPDTFSKIWHTLQFDPLVKTFQFPDQDLLALVFKSKFKPLSYRYNALKTLKQAHDDMWRDEDVKNIHYIMDKPWFKRPRDDQSAHQDLNLLWWQAYEELQQSWDGPGWDVVDAHVAQ